MGDEVDGGVTSWYEQGGKMSRIAYGKNIRSSISEVMNFSCLGTFVGKMWIVQ